MNERIREIANQMRFHGATFLVSDVELEKFAELIVKECANHIMTSSDRYRKEYFADMVLNHFGVKEDAS